jgi:WD40 repeat protein
MVTALCCEGKNFHTAVAGGAIRKYPLNVDDLTQTSGNVFTLEDSHTTCIDSSRDTNAPSTFTMGSSDGKINLCSPKWRVERMFAAHRGGVMRLSVNADGISIASGGEDGVVKPWSRNGSLRSTLVGVGTAVPSGAGTALGNI